MNKWIISLFAVIFVSVCSATPSSPEPHPEKYTFQVIEITVPEGSFNGAEINIDKIIQHPDVEIIEYPIVLAARGDSVTNDQTRAVSFPVGYEMVDGKEVIKEKAYKLGTSVSISFYVIRKNKVSYNLDISHHEQVGFDEHKDKKGRVIKVPHLIGMADDVGVAQKHNSWAMVGGFSSQTTDGKRVGHMICTRTIPPKIKQ